MSGEQKLQALDFQGKSVISRCSVVRQGSYKQRLLNTIGFNGARHLAILICSYIQQVYLDGTEVDTHLGLNLVSTAFKIRF